MAIFVVFDPECGTEFFNDERKAREHAQGALEAYRDEAVDGWNDFVTQLRWGEFVVKEQAVQTQCDPAPEGSQFDEMLEFELRAPDCVDEIQREASDRFDRELGLQIQNLREGRDAALAELRKQLEALTELRVTIDEFASKYEDFTPWLKTIDESIRGIRSALEPKA